MDQPKGSVFRKSDVILLSEWGEGKNDPKIAVLLKVYPFTMNLFFGVRVGQKNAVAINVH